MLIDFEYTDDGLFTTLYPNSWQATRELSQYMARNEGSNNILSLHFPQFRHGAEKAGYTFRPLRETDNSAMADDILLAELGM